MTETISPVTRPATGRGRAVQALVGAAGFLASYLASGPISSSFASSPAPQPNVAGEVTRAWIIENTAASGVQAAVMMLSVAFLAVFVAAIASVTRSVGGRTRQAAVAAGVTSVAAMVVSGVLALVLCVTAAGMTPETVEAIRTANFIAGGTAHVALLGLFALAASRVPGMSKPVRVFAIVVAVIAVGSLASLAVYYASILILAGRLLGMIWCAVAAISLLRKPGRLQPARTA